MILSSSDDEVVNELRQCDTSQADDGTRILNSRHCSGEIVPRYTLNSFVIYSKHLLLTVEMNPMFAWRLVCAIKSTSECEIDNTRMRTYASYDMKTSPVVFTIPHTNACYLTLLDAFKVAYADRYNTPSKMMNLLSALSDVIKNKYDKRI